MSDQRTTYEDDAVQLDEEGIVVKNHLGPRHRRHIPYRTIRSATVLELGRLSGRHRLMGLGFSRPRHFFHWDPSRSRKTHAIAIDTGRFFRTVLSPMDHRPVLEAIEAHRSTTADG